MKIIAEVVGSEGTERGYVQEYRLAYEALPGETVEQLCARLLTDRRWMPDAKTEPKPDYWTRIELRLVNAPAPQTKEEK